MSKGIAPGVLVMMIKYSCGNEGKIGTAVRHVGNVDYIENGVLDSWEVEFPAPILTCGGKAIPARLFLHPGYALYLGCQ